MVFTGLSSTYNTPHNQALPSITAVLPSITCIATPSRVYYFITRYIIFCCTRSTRSDQVLKPLAVLSNDIAYNLLIPYWSSAIQCLVMILSLKTTAGVIQAINLPSFYVASSIHMQITTRKRSSTHETRYLSGDPLSCGEWEIRAY